MTRKPHALTTAQRHQISGAIRELGTAQLQLAILSNSQDFGAMWAQLAIVQECWLSIGNVLDTARVSASIDSLDFQPEA